MHTDIYSLLIMMMHIIILITTIMFIMITIMVVIIMIGFIAVVTAVYIYVCVNSIYVHTYYIYICVCVYLCMYGILNHIWPMHIYESIIPKRGTGLKAPSSLGETGADTRPRFQDLRATSILRSKNTPANHVSKGVKANEVSIKKKNGNPTDTKKACHRTIDI